MFKSERRFMLTLFSIPKSFEDHVGVIQRNAIRSWTLLNPAPEIILLGDEKGTAEIAKELGLRHVSKVAVNQFGTPLIHDVFARAQSLARFDILCYVNTDIILLDDFASAVREISLDRYLLIGRRWDLDVREKLDFHQPDWEIRLRRQTKEQGILHAPTGIDFFVFRRGLYQDLPPFAVGRTIWDNWLIYRARSLKVHVVDATDRITVVHQNHDYNHHREGKEGIWDGTEAQTNLLLAGGLQRAFTVTDANYIWTATGIRKSPMTKARFRRELEVISVLSPRLRPFFKVFNRLASKLLA